MILMKAFDFAAMALFFAGHVWVLWELWSGRAFILLRPSSSPLGPHRATDLNEFTRTQQPFYYWISITWKVFALALGWHIIR